VLTDPDAILDALDPEQRAVATALEGPVCVLAGAGTGKTRAMTHRIAYGVATDAFDPRSVLALTFTTRAAGELRGRLRTLGVHTVQARTFHSAALRQAQYFWPQAYGTSLPPVADSLISLVAEALRRENLPVETALLRDLRGRSPGRRSATSARPTTRRSPPDGTAPWRDARRPRSPAS